MQDLPTLRSSLLPPPATAEVDYDREIRDLRANLRRTPLDKVVRESAVRANGILDTLDASQQSLVYLFVLLAHYQEHQTSNKQHFPETLQPGGIIWSKSLAFLRVFDPIQIRYCGHEWVKLVQLIVGAAESASRPLLAISPIKHALLRLDLSCSVITTTHTLLMRLCLRARAYIAAIPILDRSIYDVPSQSDECHSKRSLLSLCRPQLASVAYVTPISGLSGNLSYKSYLEYFLYGSMIYMGLKKWDNALYFLQVVMTAPTINSVSMIMVQAYKKWILVCLLAKGTVLPMPKSTNPHAVKLYKSLGRPYNALADVFCAGSFSRLKAEVDAGGSIWCADNNTGLILQMTEAYRRFSLPSLEKTFAAILVNDIPRTAFADATESQMLERLAAWLIGRKQLNAQLAQPAEVLAPTVLRFTITQNIQTLSSEVGAWDCLAAQTDRIRPLMGKMHEADIRLELCNEYVENTGRSRRHQEDGNRDRESLMRNGQDEVDLDEDIMTGIPS